jgi:hypothetical protein
MKTYVHMSPISSENEKCLRQNCREDQNTYFMYNTFSFSEDHAVYEMWQNMAVREATDDDRR